MKARAAQAARIGFHWVTAALVAIAFAAILYREGLDDPDQRLFWLDVHRSIGLTLLGLTVARVIARVILPFNRVHETAPAMRVAAGLAHIAIYLGLVAMPLLGWAQSSAKARKFKLFDIKMPSLVHHDSALGETIGQWHEWIGWTMLALIGLHALAALYHHYVRKDDVLRDMIRLRG